MSTLSKFQRERIVISTGKLVEGWCDDLWKDDAYDDKNKDLFDSLSFFLLFIPLLCGMIMPQKDVWMFIEADKWTSVSVQLLRF